MPELIHTQQKDHIFEIALNRPEKRNALNMPLIEQLDGALDEAERTQQARVILIRAEGQTFSAGIDLMGLPNIAEKFGEGWRENLFPLTQYYQGVLNKIERSTLPSIALIHGHCIGMGFELALACDFRIAAKGAQLGLPETRLGLIPDVGGTTRLTRLAGFGRAKELIMTGKQFDSVDAERWGIVNDVVEEDELGTRAHALADELIQAAPLAVSYAKLVINGIMDLERGLQMEAWAQSILIRTADFQQGAQAMMTKQKPEWRGK